MNIFLINKSYANEQEKIIMGAIHIPPYFVISANDGSITGLIPTILDSIFLPMNIKVNYKVLSIKRIKMELMSGDIDGFPLVNIQGNIADSGLLSNVYLTANNYVWAARSKYPNGIKWGSLSDLTKYKIGIVYGAGYGPKTNKFIDNNSEIFYKANTSPLNIKLLLSGRLDAIFSNEDIVKGYNESGELIRSNKALFTNNYKIILSSKSKFSSRIGELNKSIESINK